MMGRSTKFHGYTIRRYVGACRLEGPAHRLQGPLALCITARGLATIGIDKAGALPEAPLTSERTGEEGDPTPDTPSQKSTALHETAQNRRAAAHCKGSGKATHPRTAVFSSILGPPLGPRSENNTPFRDIGRAAWAVVV
jgi:hypothetical protein